MAALGQALFLEDLLFAEWHQSNHRVTLQLYNAGGIASDMEG